MKDYWPVAMLLAAYCIAIVYGPTLVDMLLD